MRPTATPRQTSRFWTFAFFVAIMALLSRGLLEITVGKSAAYAVQLGAVVGFTMLLLAFGKPRARGGRTWVLVVAYVFVLAGLLSAWASLELEGIDYFWVYLFVTFFYVAMLVVYTLVNFEVMRRIAVGPVLAIAGIALVLVAVAQQYGGFTLLPGGDLGTFGSLLRPASLTGSFLHYPIVASLLVFLLLGIGAQLKKPFYAVIALVVAVGVFASLSRSALVILAVGLVVGIVRTRRLSSRLRLVSLIAGGGLVFLILFPTGPLLERFMSIFSSDGAGNSLRIDIWTSVLNLWAESPVLIGSHLGQFTNVTSNISGIQGGVAESGVLQLLVSFGAIGMLAYYALMAGTVSVLPTAPSWFVAGAVGAIVQSAVYQSIEVLPFMVLFAWFPLIASANNEPALGGPNEVDAQQQDRVRRSVRRV